MQKLSLLLVLFLSCSAFAQRDDFRTDSILIQHTALDILPDMTATTITGKAVITFLARVDSVKTLRLDLLKMNIQNLSTSPFVSSYTYNDTIILITFTDALIKNTPYTIRIDYSGSPMQDAKWGGWYWSGNYAFNLGVGFATIPHNLGRAWFPTIDNFKSKCSFDITISVPSNLKANSNGVLISQFDSAGISKFHYQIHEYIPSYLASCNIGPYAFINDTMYSIDGRILEIRIAAAPADTNKVKVTFGKLKQTVRLFENYFGPYPFSVIGYSLIPFNAGAMEHATNIGIPIAFVDGTLNYETLWAHELSHMWWGDNITCASAEEMWINEGWASYCERLFTEHFYGHEVYQKSIDDNHRYVLQFAHLIDSGYYSLNNVPQKFTYGVHSYQKGCDMIHNLRSIDQANFFANAKDLMIQERFRTVTTDIVLHYFMQHKSCDSTSLELLFKKPRYISNKTENYQLSFSGNPAVDINLATYPVGNAPHICYPVNFYVHDSVTDKNEFIALPELNHNGYYHQTVNGGQRASFVAFDFDNLVSDANTSQHYWIKKKGSLAFDNEICTVNISNDITANDSALLYINRSWDYTGGNAPKGIQANSHGFWSIDGVRLSKLTGSVRFFYNGATPASATGYEGVDLGFITKSEDSLVLLYRPSYFAPWTILSQAIKTAGSLTDKRGSFLLNEIKKGQYCIGQYDYVASGIRYGTDGGPQIYITPNPAHDYIRIKLPYSSKRTSMVIFDSLGKVMLSAPPSGSEIEINTSGYAKGIYFIRVMNEGGVYREKFIIE